MSQIASSANLKSHSQRRTVRAVPGRIKKKKIPARQAVSKVSQNRFDCLLDRKIEYHDSPQFHCAKLTDTENQTRDTESVILDPMPCQKEVASRLKAPESTPTFIAALYDYPLLTRDQEHHLFRKMNYLNFRADHLRKQMDRGNITVARLNQTDRFLEEALQIRNVLIQSNLRLVVSIAKKLVDDVNSFDDLVSDGVVPLVRSVEIFDFDRGTRFSTYATWAVRNALFRSTPRNRKIQGRFRTGLETVFDSAAEYRSSVQADVSSRDELRETIRRGLVVLGERDQKIVNERFALEGSGPPKRFREIAEQLQISTERVRQLLARALVQLQAAIHDESALPVD
jgi:RNA polymerase sigma factor (sigma-70 family)